MGMWTTENQDTLADVLRAFANAARAAHGTDGFAYEAGFLQSTVISMLKDLPRREQKALILEFRQVTQKLEKIAVDKRAV